MAQKPDIQYIHQFYVYGSEAQVPELKPVRRKKLPKLVLPLPKIQKEIKVVFDIASLCGILVACVMMVLLTVGIQRLSDVQQENAQLERYVISEQDRNIELKNNYHAGYDPEDIREKALAIGMIPVEQAQTVAITVHVPQPEPEPTLWESICWYFTELFA